MRRKTIERIAEAASDFDDWADAIMGDRPEDVDAGAAWDARKASIKAAWKPHRPFGVTQSAWKKQMAEGRKRREAETAAKLGLPPLEDHGK